jgi:hypothetical protein
MTDPLLWNNLENWNTVVLYNEQKEAPTPTPTPPPDGEATSADDVLAKFLEGTDLGDIDIDIDVAPYITLLDSHFNKDLPYPEQPSDSNVNAAAYSSGVMEYIRLVLLDFLSQDETQSDEVRRDARSQVERSLGLSYQRGTWWFDAFVETQSDAFRSGDWNKDVLKGAGDSIDNEVLTNGVSEDEWDYFLANVVGDKDFSFALDYIKENKNEITKRWSDFAGGDPESATGFFPWAVNIYLEQEISYLIEEKKSVNINSYDPIIDPLISNLLGDLGLPVDLDSFVRQTIKKNIDGESYRNSEMKKSDLFALLGLDGHKLAVNNAFNDLIYDGGNNEAFLEGLRLDNDSLADRIFNVDWTKVRTEAFEREGDQLLYPNALNDISAFIESVSLSQQTKGSAPLGRPEDDSVSLKKLTRKKFIINNFTELEELPAYIRSIAIHLIENSMNEAELDPISRANVSDYSDWLDDNESGRAFYTNAITTALSGVDGGDRLITELYASDKGVVEEFLERWGAWKYDPSGGGLRAPEEAITVQGFNAVIQNMGLIPDELPKDKTAAELRREELERNQKEFFDKLTPMLDGLPPQLQARILDNAITLHDLEGQKNPHLTNEQLLEDIGFNEILDLTVTAALDGYFGDDEAVLALLEAFGGVKPFFEKFPDLMATPASDIVRIFNSDEGRDRLELVDTTAADSPALADYYQILTEQAEAEALEADVKELGEAETRMGVDFANMNLANQRKLLDWLQTNPSGINYMETLGNEQINERLRELDDIRRNAAEYGIRQERADLEFEEFRRLTEWLQANPDFLEREFDLETREKLLRQREREVELVTLETMVDWSETEEGRQVLEAKTQSEIDALLRDWRERATRDEAADISFQRVQAFVDLFGTPEGRDLMLAEADLDFKSAAQRVQQGMEKLRQQELAFQGDIVQADIARTMSIPELVRQLEFGRTQFAEGLRGAEFEQQVETRAERIFAPAIQQAVETRYGRQDAANILDIVAREQFQEYFAEVQTEVEREQRTGLIRFDPDVEMHPLEGRPLRPEERSDFYTPEAFVERRLSPQLLEGARRTSRLERLRPFRTPTPRRRRRNLLGGMRSFAGAEI